MKRRELMINGAVMMGALPFFLYYKHALGSNLKEVNPDIHKLKIGEIKCTVFRDLMFKYEPKEYFLNADNKELGSALRRYSAHEIIPSPFIAVLLEYGEKKILIDTGAGFSTTPVVYKGQEVLIQGKLIQLLSEEGVNKEDITDVILTHFHPDHIGGVFSSEGEINYPNATFYFHEDEWNFWHSPNSDAQPPMFKFLVEKNVTPLGGFDVKTLKNDFEEIVPGVKMIETAGHTPGHFALLIAQGNDHLIYASDTFLHPLHIERLDWQTVFDYEHEKARQSRIKLLDLAFREDILINAFHFDFPGLGNVEKNKNSWVWNYTTT